MSSSRAKKSTLLLLALTAGAGFWALFLIVWLRPERLRLASLQRDNGTLRYQIGQLQAESRRIDTFRREAAAVAARKAADSRPTAIAAPLEGDQRNLIRLIHDHPQVEAKYLVAERAALGVLAHPLFRALNLTADQQEQILAALGEACPRAARRGGGSVRLRVGRISVPLLHPGSRRRTLRPKLRCRACSARTAIVSSKTTRPR